jgi:hypothetical protein
MRQAPPRFLFAAGLVLATSLPVSAGPVAGIARTDGQPLETGPFDSQPSAVGQEITQGFQRMFLTSEPSNWTKTFRWEIPANTGLAPGATLTIMESIPLIYPADPVGADPSVKLPIADWHENMIDGDLSDFFQWDTQNPNTSVSARIGSEGLPINGKVDFASDGKTIGFAFDPIQIPIEEGTGSTPVTLDILKYIRWTGPVLDPIPTAQHIDIQVTEYPTTSEPAGDYNGDGVVDAADYTVWRDNLNSSVTLPGDTTPGMVTAADYNVWVANFGTVSSSGAGSGVNAAVPEPATLVLLLTGILAIYCRQWPTGQSHVQLRKNT